MVTVDMYIAYICLMTGTHRRRILPRDLFVSILLSLRGSSMRTWKLLGGIAVIVLLLFTVACAQTPAAAKPVVTVYKSPTCGCCTSWVDYLDDNGFAVMTEDVTYEELHELRATHGVPQELASCHTALVDGYVIEGHVPADLIETMLQEQLDVAGLAVPGMPAGAPGMDGANPQPYDIFVFAEDGTASVYAQR